MHFYSGENAGLSLLQSKSCKYLLMFKFSRQLLADYLKEHNELLWGY